MNKNAVISVISIIFFIIVLFVLPRLWDAPAWPFVVLGIFVVGAIFLVRWHAKNSAYVCPACSLHFPISAWTDFMSPHKGGVKLLRCPRCGESDWCDETNRAGLKMDEALKYANKKHPVPPAGGLNFQISVVLVLYLGLWALTFFTAGNISNLTADYNLIKIPLVSIILPIMHFSFCFYAARHGYRSRLYPLITGFVVFFLGFAIWMQYLAIKQGGM